MHDSMTALTGVQRGEKKDAESSDDWPVLASSTERERGLQRNIVSGKAGYLSAVHLLLLHSDLDNKSLRYTKKISFNTRALVSLLTCFQVL